MFTEIRYGGEREVHLTHYLIYTYYILCVNLFFQWWRSEFIINQYRFMNCHALIRSLGFDFMRSLTCSNLLERIKKKPGVVWYPTTSKRVDKTRHQFDPKCSDVWWTWWLWVFQIDMTGFECAKNTQTYPDVGSYFTARTFLLLH